MPTPTDEQVVSASLTTIMGLCIGIEDAYDDTVKPSTNKETVQLTDAVLQILMQLSNHIKLLPVHTINDEDDEDYEDWENGQQPDFDPDDDDMPPPILGFIHLRALKHENDTPTPECDCPRCRIERGDSS